MVLVVQQPPWDPAKERDNWLKHGIGFDEAQEAVMDGLARAWADPAHSDRERRAIVMGQSARGRLLYVVVAFDDEDKMRIISARRATKRERHAYEDR